MKFDVNFPDFDHPGESKTTFKQRFLLSLEASFNSPENLVRGSAPVLHVRSGMKRTFWERLAFWRRPKLSNLPLKARWAAEALSEQGFIFEIDWYVYYDTGAKHPALWVIFPWGQYEPARMKLFKTPPALPSPRILMLEDRSRRSKATRGSHLKLVWDRDKDGSRISHQARIDS